MPPSRKALSKEDQECEKHFLRSYSRKHDGRYVVRLPIIAPLPDLFENRRAAARNLQHAEMRFGRSVSFRELYTDFMRQYEALQHMTAVSGKAQTNLLPPASWGDSRDGRRDQGARGLQRIQ